MHKDILVKGSQEPCPPQHFLHVLVTIIHVMHIDRIFSCLITAPEDGMNEYLREAQNNANNPVTDRRVTKRKYKSNMTDILKESHTLVIVAGDLTNFYSYEM